MVAALEKTKPFLKGKLSWSRAALANADKVFKVNHAAPMVSNIALVIGHDMALHNKGRVGGLLLLQSQTGLRPSEALILEPENLVLPEENSVTPGVGLIVLGARRGTKAGRPQAIRVVEGR